MSKNIVSGAIALLMVFAPMSASALSQVQIPTLPQNPTIQQLLAFVVELQDILQLLLNDKVPVPIQCPIYMPAMCAAGEHLVGGDYLPNGCQGAPRCVPDTTTSLSVTPQMGAAPLAALITANNLRSSGSYYIEYGDGGWGAICNQNNGGVSNCGTTWSASHVFTNPGTYTVKLSRDPESQGNCYGSDCAVVATAQVTVTTGSTPATQITLTGPTQGAIYKVGDAIPTAWQYNGAPPNTQVVVKVENIAASNPPSGSVSGGSWQSPLISTINGSGSHPWQTGPSMMDSTGTYRVTASIRDCDPRGCSYNTEYPTGVSSARVWATSQPITFTFNSAVTGSQPGTLSIVQSESPVGQTLAAGSDAVVANYFLSATGEDVRVTVGNFAYTDNLLVDLTSCSVYDASTRVSSLIYPIYTAQGQTGTYTVTFSPGIIVPRGTTKTLSMRCLIPSSASGSFKWSLPGNAYFAAQGVSSGAAINPNITPHAGNTMTVINAGSLIVSTDASTPNFTTVSGGSTNVVMGVYKFRSTGEAVGLTKLGLKLTSGKAQDLVTVRVYSGATQVGQATFVGNNTTAVSTLFSTFAVQKDYDTTLTIRADIAQVGTNQPGIPGDIIKIDVDPSQTMGAGINSGNTITATGGTSVAGVQIAGSGTPSSNPRLLLGAVAQATVSADYLDMPANAQVVLMNQTTGARVEMAGSSMITYGGNGGVTINLTNVTAGTYYLKAQNYTTGAYIAQTVSFNYAGSTQGCTAPTITMPAAGYSLIISQPGQGQMISTTGNPSLSITLLPWATLSGSTITFNALPAAGTYPIVITASNSCGTATRTFNVVVDRPVSVCPVYQIPMCPAGQHMVTDPTTRDANNCEVPHSHCVADTASANLSVAAPTYTAGANVSVTWNSTSVLAKDWIGIVRVGGNWTGEFSGMNVGWFWAPSTSGTNTVKAPSAAGQYQLVYFRSATGSTNDSVEIGRGGTFTVTAPVALPAVEKGICTYTAAGMRGGLPSLPSAPSTILMDGGQAACSAWCSSQGAEANVYYTCSYNGAQITMIDRNAQLASALTAVESVLKKIIAWFRPDAAVEQQVTASTSARAAVPVPTTPAQPAPQGGAAPAGYPYYQPATQGTTPTPVSATAPAASAPVSAAASDTGTLRASFKGVDLPPNPNVTKRLAQALCRADAVCTWNNEPIQAAAAFGQPGDPTLVFSMPPAGTAAVMRQGNGYIYEITDGSFLTGAIAPGTYRLYFAKYTSKAGPDVIYQAVLTNVARTLSGSVKLTWEGRIEKADGSTELLPPGLYYVGAVNTKNGLKGGSTGSFNITPAQ